jgi:hypothetical protein
LITLQGTHLNTDALLPPWLIGGIDASSRVGVAHFSQLGSDVLSRDILPPT